jgi:hypothetical protein
MAFKCGHCRGRHDTVAEGRECAAKKRANAGDNTPPTPDFIKEEVDAQPEHMRPNAQKFLADLLRQFGVKLAGGMTPETVPWQDGKKVLHGLIDARRLKTTGHEYTLPDGIVYDPHAKSVHSGTRRPTQRIPLPDCEPGYYAVPGWKPDHEVIKFFWVKKKAKGEYAGQTFLDEILGGQPNRKRGGRYAVEAIEQIKAFGLEEAGALFAMELKSCCKCNKHLTKKASRVLHMGRHCAYQNGRGDDWDALNWKYNDADAEDDD